MTCTVFVNIKGNISNDVREKINSDFIAIHDQTFKQYVNIEAPSMKGEWSEMKHGINFGCLDEHGFINIPCHWDVKHGRKTLEQIKEILKRYEIEYEKADVSY